MSAICNEIKKIYNDLISGTCVQNFDLMTNETKIKTILKTVAIAAAAGLISGLLIGLLNPAAGTIVGLTIAAVVGISAFAYYTSSYNAVDLVKDHGKKIFDSIKNKFA
jgi:uncharacterized membrane protein